MTEETVRAFAIPPQPLLDAVAQFGRASGMQVSVDADVIRGVSSPGVSGTMPPQQALARLLAGTGVSYRLTGSNTAILQRVPAAQGDGTLMIPEVNVTAGLGSQHGYVPIRTSIGTRTDIPILEVPQTINVVTRDQIAAQNAQTLQQTMRYTAGVVSEPYGSYSDTVVRLRGFVQNASSFYLNGLRLQAAVDVDPYLLDRIEIIKGPASILYGQANPGGVVNLVSRLASGERIREIQVQLGFPGLVQGGFDIGDAIDPAGTVSYRVTGVARRAETGVDDVTQQRIALTPSLTWRPNEGTRVTLYGVYQHDPYHVNYNFLPASGTVLPNVNGRIGRNVFVGEPDLNRDVSTFGRIGYVAEHSLTDGIRLSSTSSYSVVSLDSYALAGGIGGPLPPDFRSVARYASSQRSRSGVFATENHVQMRAVTGPISHNLLVGVDFQHLLTNSSSGFDFASAPSLDLFSPIHTGAGSIPQRTQFTRQTAQQLGIYVQDQLRLGDWLLLLGGRQDWSRSNTVNRVLNTMTTDQTDTAFTWRAGLTYLFDNGLAPYVSYTESFEPVAGTDFSLRPFDPTRGQQYEVGIKYQPPGLTSFATLSAFRLTQQNLTTADPNHPTFSTQVGEVRSRGIEASVTASLANGLNLVGTYTYTDTVTTRSNDGLVGTTPFGLPRHSASLWGDYTFRDGRLEGLGLAAGGRYVGPTYGDNANTFKVPGFFLADLAIRYDLGGLGPQWRGAQLAVNANNITDRRYVSSCVTSNICYYGVGRTVTAQLTYRW